MEKLLNTLNELWVNAGLKLVYVLVILIIGSRLIKLLVKFLKKNKFVSKLDKSVSTFLISFINVTLYILLFIILASVLGIPSTSIITLLGSAGLAIGLALQGGLTNIAGGLLILIFKPFKVGDFIDNHTESGTVKSITIFYTTLITPDNKIISIPNGALSNQSLVNYSKESIRRLDISMDVSYENKIDDVKKALNTVIEKEDRIIKDKEIFVKITDFKESSIIYTIRVWVNGSDYWNVRFDLLENIKDTFEKNHITIPFNQLDVHIKNK